MNLARRESRMPSKQFLMMFAAVFMAVALGAAAFARVLAPEQVELPAPSDLYSVQGIQQPQPEALVSENPRLTLIAVGDIMLSRVVGRKIRQKRDVNYPFLYTRDVLKTGDIVFGNLETPITAGREIRDNELTFRSDPGVEQGLRNAGFTVLSLANNHVPNFGAKGISDTIKYLDDVGIKHAGAGATLDEALQPAVVEANSLKFAFLAFNDTNVVPASYGATEKRTGTALMDNERMTAAVKAAKQSADFVIVSMHSGVEYAAKPNQHQQDFAHAAIDAGAELVIGHHPHVVQPVEMYKGKHILYSLGNFVFDQMWSRETRQGMVAVVTISAKGVEKIDYKPVLIEDYAQPRFLDGAEAEAVLARLKLPVPL